MWTLKKGKDEIILTSDYKTETINQAFAVNMQKYNWHYKSNKFYMAKIINQCLSKIEFFQETVSHAIFVCYVDNDGYFWSIDSEIQRSSPQWRIRARKAERCSKDTQWECASSGKFGNEKFKILNSI